MSAWQDAVDTLPTCPKCGEQDLPLPAAPTLERQQNGSLTCNTCATNFRPVTFPERHPS